MANTSTNPSNPNFSAFDMQVVRDAAIDARQIPTDKQRKVLLVPDYLQLVESANSIADSTERMEDTQQSALGEAKKAVQEENKDLKVRNQELHDETQSLRSRLEKLEAVEHALGNLLPELEDIDFGSDSIIEGLITEADGALQESRALSRSQPTVPSSEVQ